METKQTIQTLDLMKAAQDGIISLKEYRGIFARALGMGQLREVLERIGKYLFPQSGSCSGMTMAWNYSETTLFGAPMGTVDLYLDHDKGVVEVRK